MMLLYIFLIVFYFNNFAKDSQYYPNKAVFPFAHNILVLSYSVLVQMKIARKSAVCIISRRNSDAILNKQRDIYTC